MRRRLARTDLTLSAVLIAHQAMFNPGGGGGLPYETDGDARRLA